ncbi:MAG: hypothetical protein QF915_01730 [Candidatus Woesearchaeota archaeon]|jgi:ElaB/YqjD/DUF883 family membrane-anchored ribosome-binding protein|nr:hypothetical protein [Candidatus Woesearchaeota archaeon]MDP7457090.1 hypothetical protein [Candidatus Woesearchaeota archaeon]|tara:strand:- start:701 stop:895 length:195 start_codon:yes stop_codon:yes gene_type:complete
MVKKMEESMQQLKAKLDDAKQKIIDLEHKFEDKVKEHPVQSVAVAFGVGILAGAVLAAVARCKR